MEKVGNPKLENFAILVWKINLLKNQEILCRTTMGIVQSQLESAMVMKLKSVTFRKEKRTLYKSDFDSQLIVELRRVQRNLVNTRVHYSSEE